MTNEPDELNGLEKFIYTAIFGAVVFAVAVFALYGLRFAYRFVTT